MASDDVVHLRGSRDSCNGGDLGLDSENIVDESQKTCDTSEDGIFTMENLEPQNEENGDAPVVPHSNIDASAETPTKSVELVESLSGSQSIKVDVVRSESNIENSMLFGQRPELGIHEKDVGVKRPPHESLDRESSVRVVYSSLPSQSKRKLEELLHNWSEWHAKHCASPEDSAELLESGEETYFPAMHIGLDKPSTVSFSMDVQVRKKQRMVSLEKNSSPMYDRGFAVGLGSEYGVSEERSQDLREAPRCFNCGSFNHSLNDCQKPRNNAAVNSARKQFLSKKSQNVGPRVLTRYYQESPGGKFDGLKPGALSAETKKLLGLGELDPPPWLNRMRELGYPPGYMDPGEEDPPSGIAIFGDEETQNEATITDLQTDEQNSRKKMTVDFPGINAPIPKDADQNRWAEHRVPPPADFSSNQLDNRHSYFQGSVPSGHLYGDYRAGPLYGDYRPRGHIEAPPLHFSYGSSPPMHDQPYHHYPSGPFSPRGIPIPESSSYGRPPDLVRPFMHHSYGSF